MCAAKTLYTFPHKSRVDKVDYLCGIGGYSSRDGRWPIEFDVSVACADLSFDNLWGSWKEHCAPLPEEEVGEFKRIAAAVYADIGSYLFEWALDDCRRDIDPREGDTYFMLFDAEKPLRAELSLAGRGGKHLVIEDFEGITLRGMSEDDLREYLMRRSNGWDTVSNNTRLFAGFEWEVPTDKLNILYRYVRQCEVDFTPKNACRNMEYYAASTLLHRAEEAYQEYLKTKASHEAVVSCARVLRRYLKDKEGEAVMGMLETLAVAAGVSNDEFCEEGD